MTLVIFAIGLLIFFLTVYGTVVAGGLELTKRQVQANPELAPELVGDAAESAKVSTRDIARAEF